MQEKMTPLQKRVWELAYKFKTPVGSSLAAVEIIDEIYSLKKPDEKFVLSAGHYGLALYVVIEKYLGIDAEKIWRHHGRHPDRCEECHLDCSTGSLGMGLSVAVGMALANRMKDVWCLISDGEFLEGSTQEALRTKLFENVSNLKVLMNFNGWGAYSRIVTDGEELPGVQVCQTNLDDFPFLRGLEGHYHILTKEEYETGLC